MSLNPASIRAVIIDLDGTMVDTAPDFLVALNGMRAELDLKPIDIETVKRFVGKGTEHLLRSVLALDLDAAAVEGRFDAALAAYMRHYLAINGQHSRVYPGVHEGLRKMRDHGLQLACVTNKPVALARPLLATCRLDTYFELLYGGDSLPRKKPDPYPLRQVCRDFGLAPSQVVAIGDSSNDALAARAAGCAVLTVPYGYNHGESVQMIDSDGIVASLQDAAQLIIASVQQ